MKDRKQWLIATIVFFILYPLLVLVFLAIFPEQRTPTYVDVWYVPLAYTLTNLTLLWIIWHFAYKNQGTALLTCWLIWGPIRVLLSTTGLFKESWTPWVFIENVLDLSIYAWWYILSLRLRRMNKKKQVPSCPEYIESLQVLKEQTSRESLNEEFSKLIRNWPQFEPTSSKEYKLKKTELSGKIQ